MSQRALPSGTPRWVHGRQRELARPIAVMVAGVALLSCSSDSIVKATVGPARVCTGNPWRMVPVATDASGQRHALRDEPASMLESVPWGSEHRVELRIRTHEKSVAGLGGRSVRLSRVTSSSPQPGARLVLPVNPSCFRPDRRSFLDGQALQCASDEVCRVLDEELGKVPSRPFELDVQVPASAAGPLLVEAVRRPDERTCLSFPCPRDPP